MRHRDRGRRFPGCRRTGFAEIHHIRHRADGGDTCEANLIWVCGFHHGLPHEHSWTVTGDPAGELTWRRPDGKAIRAVPHLAPSEAIQGHTMGSLGSMPKDTTTVSVHRSKVNEAKALVDARSTSEVNDIALDRLIRSERLRKDITAYRQHPPTEAEIALAVLADTRGLADDTDWEALYAEYEG